MGMMTMLLGASSAAGGAVITITDQTVQDFTGGGSSANTEYRLNSNGGVYTRVGSGSYTLVENWVTPTTAAADYEVYATVTAGALSSGTAGSWLPLSSVQTWTASASIGNNQFCVFTVDIRKVGTGTVLDSATITLEADAQL